jgi:hypothetical protein
MEHGAWSTDHASGSGCRARRSSRVERDRRVDFDRDVGGWYASGVTDIDLREKLRSEILPSEWAMLAMHHRRDAIFMVDDQLDLLEVALAVAQDDAEVVQAWIEAGRIARPTLEQVACWEAEEGAPFLSVIVQPYVLAQRVEDYVAAATVDA